MRLPIDPNLLKQLPAPQTIPMYKASDNSLWDTKDQALAREMLTVLRKHLNDATGDREANERVLEEFIENPDLIPLLQFISQTQKDSIASRRTAHG